MGRSEKALKRWTQLHIGGVNCGYEGDVWKGSVRDGRRAAGWVEGVT